MAEGLVPSVEARLPATAPGLSGPTTGPTSGPTTGPEAEGPDGTYAKLFEASAGAKYMCTPDGAIQRVNLAFCRLFGFSPTDVLGRALSSFSTDPALPASELEPFLAGTVPAFSSTRRYRRGDGRTLRARVTLGAVRAPDGRPVLFLGEVEDATAEDLAHHELDRQRHRLELAIEASGISVWELDVASGRVTVQEHGPFPAGRAGAGAREHNMTYGDFVRSFHPEDRALFPPIRAIRSGAWRELDVELRAGLALGPVRWVHLRGRVVTGDGGTVARLAGTTADVTEPRARRAELAAQRDRLELALETANMMAWELDLGPQPCFRPVRPDLLGLEVPAELTVTGLAGSPIFSDRVYPADRPAVSAALAGGLGRAGDELDIEYRWYDDSGALRWAHTRARAEAGLVAGRDLRVTGTTADVTPTRLEVSARLRAERVLSRTLEASQDAFIGTDGQGLVTEWNPAAEALFGWFRDEVVGRPLPARICGPGPSVLDEVLNHAGPDGAEGAAVRRELEALSRDGRRFPAEVSAVKVEEGGTAFFQLFVRDLSERKAYESQLVRNALYDSLTGLPNRALLVDRLTGALRRLSRASGVVAVLFVDVDRFKHVNDSLGHRGGDEFLAELARRLRAVLRPADTIGRFGADEFVVLCEALEGEREAMALALRVEGVFAAPFTFGRAEGREVYASASVGIAVAGPEHADGEALLRDAATAMHRAKEHGGGHAEVFDAEIRSRSLAHLETESELRRALEHQELCVYYQPVVDLTGRLLKVEALVRWPQRSGRVALPAEFVPVAEETGLIVALGESVLGMACAQVHRWRTEYPRLAHLEVAVNVSSAQLRARDAVERMASSVESAGLPADALVLEITESVFMDERSGAAKKLAALRSMGVRLAVDDFGTGYSSLLYLRRYPLDMLKIDRSFVAGLVDNAEDATIVDAVVRLGHSFGLQTVAEGVETAEQLRLLRSLGCDMGQGHFWGRPLPPESLISLMLDDAALMPGGLSRPEG